MGSFDSDVREWMEADGLGGFASGTVSTRRTRRYHALLLVAQTPPADRWVLVNGLEAWVEVDGMTVALSSQRYPGGVVHPDGATRIRAFRPDPWPQWTFDVADGAVTFDLAMVRGEPLTVLRWTPSGLPAGARLFVRPLLSGRDPHQLRRESADFAFEMTADDGRIAWTTHPTVPPIYAQGGGRYVHAPLWYRDFVYDEEAARGLDHVEDLASPGYFEFDMAAGAADLVLTADRELLDGRDAAETATGRWAREAVRRRAYATRLARAADDYVVRRGEGRTVIAGYPWFGDWGRDTFIALRGLRLLPDGHVLSQSILRQWSGAVSEGMLPNRFPDRGDEPEYNSVDASLWYVLGVRDLLEDGPPLAPNVKDGLLASVHSILRGYASGTRYGIRADEDGLLRAGEHGVQLTWMDAKVGDWVVTPRVGKPVEIQALWLNALDFAQRYFDEFTATLQRGTDAFAARFFDSAAGYLRDVVDVDHEPGRNDSSLRPNQLFAAGALPLSLVDAPTARAIVDRVEQALWTPMGLRSLAPQEADYVSHYQGGVRQRDGAYHQGTVWAWLIGPFVDAWVRARGGGADAQREARRRFLAPLFAHLSEAGLGHVSEIADGDAPHLPRGAPFQAWSVTELYRLDRTLAT